MDDRNIIKLFFARDEAALSEIGAKYGKYCTAIAQNILGNAEDAEEIWSDTMLCAWNSIPPEEPQSLKVYLSALARNRARDRYRMQRAEKRGGSEYELCLEEAEEFLADTRNISEEDDLRELLNAFLRSLPERECNIFIRRYYYFEQTPEIAKKYGIKEPHVLVILSRVRKKLKSELEKGGYAL